MANGLQSAVAAVLVASGCASAPHGAARTVRSPRPADAACVARAVRIPPSVAASGVSFRATAEFWVEADGTPGPVDVSWSEALGVEENEALANEVAVAVAHCAWLPANVDGGAVRARAALPMRFAGDEQAEPAAPAPGPAVQEGVKPAREADPGCVARAMHALSAEAPAAAAVVAVRVEGDGSRGPARVVKLTPGFDETQREVLEGWVASALKGCSFVPGTVGGRPSSTVWISEVRTGR